jgi:hypothetical protein
MASEATGATTLATLDQFGSIQWANDIQLIYSFDVYTTNININRSLLSVLHM